MMDCKQVLEDSKGVKKERWVRDNPGQMVITAGQIAWTAECEAAMADAGSARKKLSTLKKKWISYLEKLTGVTQSQLTAIERNKVSRLVAMQQTPFAVSLEGPGQKMTLDSHAPPTSLKVLFPVRPCLHSAFERPTFPAASTDQTTWADWERTEQRFAGQVVALITIEVHARDVIDKLSKAGVTSHSAFEWSSQLRFYWDVDNSDCSVKQVRLLNVCYTQSFIDNDGIAVQL